MNCKISYRWLIYAFILIVVVLTGCNRSGLISHNIDSLEKIRVDYYGQEGSFGKELNMTDNKELVKELYEQVSRTKAESHPNPSEMDSQESQPKFIITFSYSYGGKDKIWSSETGRVIFRRISENGWVGGRNDAVLKLVKEMKSSDSDDKALTKIAF